MNASVIKRVARVVVGLGLLGWLLASVDLAELGALVTAGDLSVLGYSLLALFMSLLFQALRLHILIRRFTGSLLGSMRLFLVGMLFNNVLPSGVGGDAVRLVYLKNMRTGGWAAPLGLLLVHRVSGVVVIVLAATVVAGRGLDKLMGLLTWRPGAVLVVAIAALLVAAVSVLLLRQRLAARLRRGVNNARAAVAELTAPDWLGLALFTVAFHGLRVFGFVLAVAYLGGELSMAEGILVLTTIAVISLLPVSVGGLGVVEGTMALALTAFGVSPPAATGVALLNRFTLLAVAGLGGIVYALDRPRRPEQAESPDEGQGTV